MKILLIILIFISLSFSTTSPGLLPDASTLDSAFQRVGILTDTDWRLLRVIASVESNMRPHVKGDRGRSIGLMQVKRSTAAKYGVHGDNLFDPLINITTGALYLRDMINLFGFTGGIQAYALGETRYRKGLRAPAYFKKVWGEYSEAKREGY